MMGTGPFTLSSPAMAGSRWNLIEKIEGVDHFLPSEFFGKINELVEASNRQDRAIAACVNLIPPGDLWRVMDNADRNYWQQVRHG